MAPDPEATRVCMSTERVMTLREDPIVIDTAHGPIEIHRILEPRRPGRLARRLRIKLPPGVFIRVGLDQLAERSPWVELTEGRVVPRHDMLRSSTTDAGDLELQPVKALKVVGIRP